MQHHSPFNHKPAVPSPGATVAPPVTTNNTTIASTSGWTFVPIRNGTAAPLTINLPSAPKAGQIISIADQLGNAGTYNITISGNGNNIVTYGAAASTYTLNADGASVSPLVWDSVNSEWVLFGVA